MKINKIIPDFIKWNLLLQNNLKENKWNAKPDHNSVQEFIKLTKESRYNYQVGIELAILLQSVDDKDIYEQYSLENIRDLFISLIELRKSDLENYVEASHFEWAVMDNKEKALNLIEAGIKNAELKIEEFKKLQREINN